MTRTDLKAFYFLNVQGRKSFFNTQETNQRISHFVMHSFEEYWQYLGHASGPVSGI